MRVRTGNPYREPHGKPLRCLEWIAPAGTDPNNVPVLIEAVLPGLKLFHRGDGEVHGFVITSPRPDGSVLIIVNLYDTACAGGSCPAGHPTIAHRVAPVITAAQQVAIKAAIGEHPVHKLTNQNAAAVLHNLGYSDTDGPLRRE